MRGLIVKNAFSIVRKNEIFIIMLLLVNAVFMTILTDLSFLAAVTMLFTAILVQNHMAEEEKSGYTEFERSMPVSPRDAVLSRYLTGIGFAAVGAAASALTQFFVSFMFDMPFDVIAYAKQSFFYAGVAFVMLCLLLPVYYRFGTKYVPVVNILLVVVWVAVNYFLEDAMPLENIETGPAAALAAVSLAVIALSVWLSLRFEKQKRV